MKPTEELGTDNRQWQNQKACLYECACVANHGVTEISGRANMFYECACVANYGVYSI